MKNIVILKVKSISISCLHIFSVTELMYLNIRKLYFRTIIIYNEYIDIYVHTYVLRNKFVFNKLGTLCLPVCFEIHRQHKAEHHANYQ